MGEALWWFVIAAVFVVAEFGHRAFYALFVALGAIVAAVLAVAGAPVFAQIPAFLAAAAAGLVLLRPMIMRSSAGQYRLISGIRGHVGQQALVVEAIGGSHSPGRVRLNGELWKAVSSDGSRIPAGTEIMILDLEGTTFVVEDLVALGLALPPAGATGTTADPEPGPGAEPTVAGAAAARPTEAQSADAGPVEPEPDSEDP